MKIFAFIFAIAMGRGFGPRFPQFPQDNRFFLEAAAQALQAVNKTLIFKFSLVNSQEY